MSLQNLLLSRLQAGLTTVWLRSDAAASRAPGLPIEEIDAVVARFARFRGVLSALFRTPPWDGRVESPLLRFPKQVGPNPVWIKADHLLPMTGSVKARGGVHELLCAIEDHCIRGGILQPDEDAMALLSTRGRRHLSRLKVSVASTGNLGFSVGVVARAFGVSVEVHMSADAKQWKKDRLRALGAVVVEYETDYSSAVASARRSAELSGAYFIDDERSRRLFAGYSAAGRELALQLRQARIDVGADLPLVVYLPCGVGGAPGGISAGLVHEFGDGVILVFVEPIASACMLTSLAFGERRSVREYGLDNKTIADGLAVPRVSELALELMGERIDAAVAVPDSDLLDGVRMAWKVAKLRLEPSAAAGLAAIEPFLSERRTQGRPVNDAVHVVWTTGGSLLPDHEFLPLIS